MHSKLYGAKQASSNQGFKLSNRQLYFLYHRCSPQQRIGQGVIRRSFCCLCFTGFAGIYRKSLPTRALCDRLPTCIVLGVDKGLGVSLADSIFQTLVEDVHACLWSTGQEKVRARMRAFTATYSKHVGKFYRYMSG